MTDIVIAGGARTPVGSFNGVFAQVSAANLGKEAISGALDRSSVAPQEVDEVIMGQILSAGQGQNPARQAAMSAGLPQETTAWGLNQLCGSGLRAVAVGMQQILAGDAEIIIAGGQENMTMAPHCAYLRAGHKLGDYKMIDSMMKDGLLDAFHGYHMGNTAENIARKWQITRDAQDRFAVASQNKAEKAQKEGQFDAEITPVKTMMRKQEKIIDQDEYIRHGVTLETIANLRPAFDKEGTVTPANASGINDGAAAVLLMKAAQAEKRGITPLARIVSWATAGVDPAIMGTGPIPASCKALAKAGWTVDDLELVEANEAFAVQACAVNREMGWDPSIVNVNGGAIAIGHPIGASGCRVLLTLLYEMQKTQRQERACDLMYRRRNGRCNVRCARLTGLNNPAQINDKRSITKEKRNMSEIALVSGGTRGIGAAIAKELVARGVTVGVTYLYNEEVAQKFQKETGIGAYKWDVGDQQACFDGIAQVTADLGPIDILVNNAGITRDAMMHKMTGEKWNAVINANLNSMFYMSRSVIEAMRERGGGRIINISSVNGQKGQMGQTNYSAAKAGIIGFTKALAQENARKNIAVNCVCPGYIATDMVNAMPEKIQDSIRQTIPMGRFGTAEEIAGIVAYLACDPSAAYCCGSIMTINGGLHMANG